MNKTKKLVTASMFAVIIFVVTMVVKIPVIKGYINLGDGAILIASWMLPAFYSTLAAAIGSALADFALGYAVYIPATFIIKGLMALATYYVYFFLSKKFNKVVSCIISGIIAEIIMIGGYLLYESFLYGFIPAFVNAGTNLIQGLCGLIAGVVLFIIIDKRLNK